jgi:hypothetical protein
MRFQFGNTLKAGLKMLALPAGAVAPNTGWFTWGTLPGTSYDFRRLAGDLWRNGVVSICLAWMDDTFGEARLMVVRPTSDGKKAEVPNHPLVALLENPNPWYDGSTLFGGINLSMMVDGNAYLVKLPSEAGKLVGLHYIPHFQIEPVWGGPDGWVNFYWWTVGSRRYRMEVDQIIHLRDRQDPRNQVKGLSRLGAMLREVCTANEYATYHAGLLHSAGLQRLLISPKALPEGRAATFGGEQAQALKRLWRESGAVDNQIDPIVPTVPIDVNTPGFSPEQMLADKLGVFAIDMICAAMQVDAMAVGLPSASKTYSNIKEAKRNSYENVKQAHRRLDRQLTKALVPVVLGCKPGDELDRDYSNVTAFQEDRADVVNAAVMAFEGNVISRATAKRWIGEPFTPEEEDLYSADLLHKTLTEQEDITPEQNPPTNPKNDQEPDE